MRSICEGKTSVHILKMLRGRGKCFEESLRAVKDILNESLKQLLNSALCNPTYSRANTSLGQSQRARTILVIYKRCYQLCSSL